MNNMKINLNDKEIELKYSFRALMAYENVMDKSLEMNTLSDILTFFYCIVITSAKDNSIKFDEFMDYVDEHPEAVAEFNNWLATVIQSNAFFNGGLATKTNNKKAKK